MGVSLFNEGLLINSSNLSVAELNKIFVTNNIEIVGIIEDKITLEDYFKKVTGGHGIG